MGQKLPDTNQSEKLLMTVGIKLHSGRSLLVANLKKSLDPFRNMVLNRKVIVKKTTSPTILFAHIEKVFDTIQKIDQVCKIYTVEQLAKEFEADSIKVLKEGIKMHRLILMAEEEVEAEKRTIQTKNST